MIGGVGEAEEVGGAVVEAVGEAGGRAGAGWFVSGRYAAMERLIGFAVRRCALVAVAVNKNEEAQEEDENGEHNKARYEQVLLARLCLGSHG